MGLRAEKKYKLFNGPLPAELLLFSVAEENFVKAGTRRDVESRLEGPADGQPPETTTALSPGAQMLANRLGAGAQRGGRSEEHTSELQSRGHLVCRLLLEK